MIEKSPSSLRNSTMSTVRFKFRSSATFDSVEIGEQSSISIRDLKSKIVLKKHLNLCHGFDLVFSDSISGQEYTDENTRIASGSSVIIKRIPAKSPPSLRGCDISAGCFGIRNAKCVDVIDHPSVEVGVNGSDDFGVDLCPPPLTNICDNGKLLPNNNEKKDCVVPRCSQDLLVRCQKLEVDHHSKSTPKDSSANEGSMLVMPKPKVQEQTKPERMSPTKHLAMETSDMPSELKCSLCRTYFKEAVMIPCCQHSFCGKCIREALSLNSKCPMCSSTKCKPEDLLPNVSLRQAIERFLESQLVMNGSENDLHRYAPDGESGIQVKEFSSATIVPPRHLHLSEFATWDKLNQVMQSKLHDHAQLADKCNPGTLEDFSEFQGENDPQSMVGNNEEAVSCSNKGKGPHALTGGGERNFTAPGRPNKGLRTCYMCGSPDHLIRDCPGAAQCRTSQWNGVASLPGAVSSYPQPYWPGSAPPSRPFINMYGGPGMMFYNTTAAPISPFAYPSYAPSMYGGYPVSEYANVGGMTVAGNFVQQARNVECLELQGRASQQRESDVELERERNFNRNHNVDTHHGSSERGPYHSGDGSARRSEGKHRSYDNSDGDHLYLNSNRQGKTAHHLECERDLRVAKSGRSSSETDVLDSRIRHREDRHEKLHRTYRNYDERGAQHGHDSIQKHNQPKKESTKKRRMVHNERSSDRHSHSRSRSSLEPSYSGGDVRQRREGSSHRSRNLNKSVRNDGKEMHHDHGKIKYPGDYGEDCHSHKRKRYH